MNKTQLILTWVIISITNFCFSIPAYSSWTEYKNVSYEDLNGDMEQEIIIEARHGAGSNHYLEDMRIFKDEYPELKLIFSIRTLDSFYGFAPSSPYNCNEISDVKFTESIFKAGVKFIIVKSKKIYYKDSENKIIDKEEDLGSKLFKWNGKTFVENKAAAKKFKVDLDNDGKKEIITTEDRFDPDVEGIITVWTPDNRHLGSFSMSDHFGEVKFVSFNKDGYKQIVAWSYGGAHYTNLAIYGMKDGKLYKIFKNGSACPVKLDLKPDKPMIRVGRANWGQEGWCYASGEYLWQVYLWDGEGFVYDEKLSTTPIISETGETGRYIDKANELMGKHSSLSAAQKETIKKIIDDESFVTMNDTVEIDLDKDGKNEAIVIYVAGAHSSGAKVIKFSNSEPEIIFQHGSSTPNTEFKLLEGTPTLIFEESDYPPSYTIGRRYEEIYQWDGKTFNKKEVR